MLPFLGPECLEAIQDRFGGRRFRSRTSSQPLWQEKSFSRGAFSGIGPAIAQAGALRGAVSILVDRKPRREALEAEEWKN